MGNYIESEKLSFREWVNEHSAGVTLVVVGALVVAMLVLFRSNGSVFATGPMAFYYDTVTKQVFAAHAEERPPIQHEGHEAVRVYFYGCGDCSDKFVGYYEKFSPEAKSLIESMLSAKPGSQPPPNAADIVQAGRLYSADAVTWVPAESEKGRAIEQSARVRCGEKPLKTCAP